MPAFDLTHVANLSHCGLHPTVIRRSIEVTFSPPFPLLNLTLWPLCIRDPLPHPGSELRHHPFPFLHSQQQCYHARTSCCRPNSAPCTHTYVWGCVIKIRPCPRPTKKMTTKQENLATEQILRKKKRVHILLSVHLLISLSVTAFGFILG